MSVSVSGKPMLFPSISPAVISGSSRTPYNLSNSINPIFGRLVTETSHEGINKTLHENPFNHLNLSKYASENISRTSHDVPEKVYYGLVKTMSRDDSAVGTDFLADGSASRKFSLYAFLHTLKPQLDKKQDEPKKSKVLPLVNVKNPPPPPPVKEDGILEFIKGRLFAKPAAHPNHGHIPYTTQNSNKPSNYDEINALINQRDKYEMVENRAKVLPKSNMASNNMTDSRWRQYTDLLMGLVRNPKAASEMMAGSPLYNYTDFLTGERGQRYTNYNSVLANWTSKSKVLQNYMNN